MAHSSPRAFRRTTRLPSTLIGLTAAGLVLIASAPAGADPAASRAEGSGAGPPQQASCLPASPPGRIATENQGTGSLTFPITASGLIEDTHYVVTRHMSTTPAVIAGYDTATGTLAYEEEVVLDGEASEGTWGATVSGDDLYVGMSFTGDRRSSILRVEHETGELTEVGSTAPADLIWAMATAPDGVVYAATSRQNLAGLWEHDPSTGETEFLGHFEEVSRQDARSVAATDDTVYLGIGNAAPDLWAYDRASGERTPILPPELSDASYVYTLAATEEIVAVGTSSPATLTVIDQNNHDDYEVVPIPSGTVQSIEIVDDVVYFTGGRVLWSYDTSTGELTEIADVDVAGGQTRGLFHRDGVLHGSNNIAHVWTYDLRTDELTVHNLIDAGVSARGEPAQSLTVSEDHIFTGGHVMLGVRERDTAEHYQVPVPGEPKSSVVVDGVLYMAMYSGGDLVSYDPETGEIEIVAESPAGHNRPRKLHHEPERNLLLMSNQADTSGGGSLVVYDVDTGESTTHFPFDKAVSAVTSDGGAVYVAGSVGMQDPESDATVAAWDVDNGEAIWELDPVPGSSSITGLVAVGDHVYGLTGDGTVFVIDANTEEVVATETGFGTGDLVEHNGGVYGATENLLFAVDTETFESSIVLDDLNAQWFTWPGLASDGCGLFVLDGTDVVQVTKAVGRPADRE